MAQGIAAVTKMCEVCGGLIQKGMTSVRFAPDKPETVRCYECYGKPDKFSSKVMVKSDVNKSPELEPTELPADWYSQCADKFEPQSIDLSYLEDDTEEEEEECVELPVKPKTKGKPKEPEQSQDEEQAEAKPDKQPEPPPPPAQSEQPPQDPFQMMVDALTPPVSTNVSAIVLDKQHAVGKQLLALTDLANKVDSAAKKAAKSVEDVETALAKAIQKFENAEAGKAVVDLSVKLPEDKEFKFEGIQHKNTARLLKRMSLRLNIYLHGPAGSGKSTAARKCAEALGLPFYYISLNPQASPSRIEGYMNPAGDYVPSLFRLAYENGGVYVADEVDNSSANLWTSINNTIDSDLGSFPDKMVKRHPDFIFVGTGNTNLSGDAVYKDRRPLDKATISRFSFLYWDYDEALELYIVRTINPKAEAWHKWVCDMRKYAKEWNPIMYSYCTPRASIDGAKQLLLGESAAEVAEAVLFKSTFDKVAVEEALKKCPLPKVYG